MKFPSPLVRGILLKRYRRSLVDVQLDDGTTITAHNGSFGQMIGCSELGRPVLLSESKDKGRRHPHTWEMIDMNGVWIGVNPANAHKVVAEAIAEGKIPSLLDYELQSEVTLGPGRKIDLFFQGLEENCFANIHSVTWVENSTAFFPDAPSPPAQKAMQELTAIAQQGHRAIAIFIIQRSDCAKFKPADRIDRAFLRNILAAHSAGVEILAYRAVVTPNEILLGDIIPHSLD
jgi:sugar fermentation stimulation protein A